MAHRRLWPGPAVNGGVYEVVVVDRTLRRPPLEAAGGLELTV
jgi:hypothetical protein